MVLIESDVRNEMANVIFFFLLIVSRTYIKSVHHY